MMKLGPNYPARTLHIITLHLTRINPHCLDHVAKLCDTEQAKSVDLFLNVSIWIIIPKRFQNMP